MLDVRTLFFTAALFSVFEAGALVYVWLTRRTYPGFSQWTQALVAGGGGTVLIFLRGVLPDVLTYDLSSLLLLLSAVLMLAGSARFFAAPRNLARRWWLMGACWLGLVYFRAGEPNYAIRVVLASLALGVLYLDHAALLFGRPQPGLRRTCRVWPCCSLAMAPFSWCGRRFIWSRRRPGISSRPFPSRYSPSWCPRWRCWGP